jgi:hypothetical protein
MLVIGGRQPSSLMSWGTAQDPWMNGLGVFDMTAFAWSDIYNASAGLYEQPKVVQHYYASR